MSENENTGAAAGAQKSNGMATASLVLGIVSIVLCWIWIVGVLTGILAIILGVLAKKKIKEDSSMGGGGAATGGLVTGIIGTLISLITVILVMWVFSTVAGSADELEEAFRGLEEMQKNNQ